MTGTQIVTSFAETITTLAFVSEATIFFEFSAGITLNLQSQSLFVVLVDNQLTTHLSLSRTQQLLKQLLRLV